MPASSSTDTLAHLRRLIELQPGAPEIVSGTILDGQIELSRDSKSWGDDGREVAAAQSVHREVIDGVPALFLGRRTHNLLDRAFAPFDAVPECWQHAGSPRLEEAGLSFGRGSLRIDATNAPVTLSLPVTTRDPADDVPLGGTAQVGVQYQLSACARGTGKITLRLRNLRREAEDNSHSQSLTDTWQRPCVGLPPGEYEVRELEAIITLEAGIVWLDGLLLEPYIVSNRTAHRAAAFPAPGAWAPGGETRDRDRLALPIRAGAIPKSGMIDFWCRPTWHPLHCAHTFFQMCHWYFTFELRGAGPILFAGQRPCEWQYFWEWGQGQGYAANTWHHFACVWHEAGGVTLYLDGQARSHAEQVPAHALNPEWLGETLVIGGTLDGTMELDSNVPGELDAYLASWRLHAGEANADDVLLAMESTTPRPLDLPSPIRHTFPVGDQRHLIERSKEFCWFPCAFSKKGDALIARTARGDDGGIARFRNHFARRGVPSYKESHDGGVTWQPSDVSQIDKAYELADGRIALMPYIAQGNPPTCEIIVHHPDGRVERIIAEIDMTALLNGKTPALCLALHTFMQLHDGSFRILAYLGIPGESGSSVAVLRSDDLLHWQAIARPYRPDARAATYEEPGAAQLPDGRLIVLMRTGGWNEKLAKGYSDDGGYTWTPAMSSGLHGISPALCVLADGTLLVSTGRPGIILALSTDGGETFATCLCMEDDRIHEFSSQFGWYGYSSMNNGLVVDKAIATAYMTYDMLTERIAGDGTNQHSCYIRPFTLRHFSDYAGAVTVTLAPDAAVLAQHGAWRVVPGVLAVTGETGATISGSFDGVGLVALLETSTHAGAALVNIDDGEPRRIPLYLPYRKIQRLLLADGLTAGPHTFQLTLELGLDPQHKFANPEMALLGGQQTIHLSGVDAHRRLAVYGFEVLKG